MGFELLVKGSFRHVTFDPNVIAVRKSLVSFGSNIVKSFKNKLYIEVYLDRKEKLIGFKPCDSNITGFKLEGQNSKSRKAISCKMLRDTIPLGVYPTRLDNGMVVIEVSEIAEKKQDDRILS